MEQDISKKPTTSLIGAWRLVSSEIREVGGEIILLDTEGFIIYNEQGFMSAQHFKPDALAKGTPEEIKSAFEVSASYYGTYEVSMEKGFIVHHVENSMFPNPKAGTDMKRFLKFSDNNLILTAPTMQIGERKAILVFVWERVINFPPKTGQGNNSL
ncbi:MAG: lipocalin-like domain-containing protein [Deltaproteobacteria bacterium]|nr:lipocalin-like domain-containing protein [Deltaproteobacteria bacterium]